MGKGAAAIDVDDQQTGSVRVLHHAVVHEILKVDLCRTSRPFDEDKFVSGLHGVERASHRRPEMLSSVTPGHGSEVVANDPIDNHLALGISLGLE